MDEADRILNMDFEQEVCMYCKTNIHVILEKCLEILTLEKQCKSLKIKSIKVQFLLLILMNIE